MLEEKNNQVWQCGDETWAAPLERGMLKEGVEMHRQEKKFRWKMNLPSLYCNR